MANAFQLRLHPKILTLVGANVVPPDAHMHRNIHTYMYVLVHWKHSIM